MHVKLLGTAAGGAFPQWNCACRNCRAVREGVFPGKARSHLQVAISADGQTWFLLNASPDIRLQVETCPVLQPSKGIRGTPVGAVVLTSADLDQVLGLLMLREFQKFEIYATAAVQRILQDDNAMFAMLNRVPDQASWIDILPGRAFALSGGADTSNLCCTPVSLGQHFPSYVSRSRQQNIRPDESLLGLLIQSTSGRKLGYFPAVPRITPALMEVLRDTDLLLFDGTFWCDDELISIRGTGPSAREIGHIPVWGEDGSLNRLSGLKARKIYVHINNTNPMLNESGREYSQVREAGWEVGEDGWEFEL
jgi:pyrroloquinoline quinone biosynthesis protein B